jgi:hypothetical protein
MNIDKKMLEQFESQLNPQDLAASPIPAKVLGYGEISSIFQIGNDDTIAYKRLPLFPNHSLAEEYTNKYNKYCSFLQEAGLILPEDATHIVSIPRRPVVLYIAQKRLPEKHFGHRLIHDLDQDAIHKLIEKIVRSTALVWEFNRAKKPGVELSIDGQISNWVWTEERLYFVDTSTPLYRINDTEQMDPEPLLKSAPGFLRWMLRLFFLEDVMTRYYDRRKVSIDLAANLFKEQRPDLIPPALEIINASLPSEEKSLTHQEIDKYYKGDKMIWALFLAFRRVDRGIKTRLLRGRYEFILPGKIKR